jgi:ABC-type transporter Mla subunit MlaD
MSDDIFRMVVAAGVVLAAIAFVVQAIVGIVTLGAARKMQRRIEALADRAEPLINRAGPVLEKAAPAIDKAGVAIEKLGPMFDKAGPAIDAARGAIAKIGPAVDRITPIVEKVGPIADRAAELLATAQEVVQETRPRIQEVSGEVVEIVKTGRQQVEHFGELLSDAGEKARTRLEQIDATVGGTVATVEEATQNVKRAVTRPVREVNGLAAGISAAVSTLVKGPRKSSVVSATQDEEMFI